MVDSEAKSLVLKGHALLGKGPVGVNHLRQFGRLPPLEKRAQRTLGKKKSPGTRSGLLISPRETFPSCGP